MKKQLLVVILAAAVFASCQKEIDWGTGASGNTTGDLLKKVVSKSGTDSSVTVYTYNSSRKLINEKITGMSNGVDVTNEFRYYRDVSGVITRYVQINPNLVIAGIDSVTTYVHYDAATSRYTSSVSSLTLFGFTVMDSTVLVYDAGGKVSREDTYESIPLLGGGYDLTLKSTFTAAASNVTQMDQFSHDAATGADNLESTIKYTYDSKTTAFNPSVVFLNSSEAAIIGRYEMISANNAVKIEIVSVSTPSANQITSVAYTYNSSNKPATSVNTTTPSGQVANVTYTYQ